MKAIFLDRDGVINDGQLVHKTEQFRLFDITANAIKILNETGLPVIVITNQPVVARGLCDEEMVKKINEQMVTELSRKGAKIDAVYYCPHHPERQHGGNLDYRFECDCRKPKTGMLEKAANDFNLDLKNCFFVGDSMRDMRTAKSVGCTKILVKTGHGGSDSEFYTDPDFICTDIQEAALLIKKMISLKAVILAGGLGTRMKQITGDRIPKPMLLLENKPILEHQINLLKTQGVENLIICVGHLAEKIKGYFGDGSRFGVNIEYSEENEPLGTGGAIKNAERLIDSTFLIIYGDLAMNMKIKKLLGFHEKNKGLLTVVLHESDHPHDSDMVEINGGGRVLAFLGKPGKNQPLTSNLTKTSIYVSEPRIFRLMPGGKFSFEEEVIPKVIELGKCFGFVTDEFIKDIGTPERYEKNKHLEL
jgi:histidinol-phosphate phosphatase family protein